MDAIIVIKVKWIFLAVGIVMVLSGLLLVKSVHQDRKDPYLRKLQNEGYFFSGGVIAGGITLLSLALK